MLENRIPPPVVATGSALDGHEMILSEARPLARDAALAGDDGSSDLLTSQVVRVNELHSWFVGEHLSARAELDAANPSAG